MVYRALPMRVERNRPREVKTKLRNQRFARLWNQGFALGRLAKIFHLKDRRGATQLAAHLRDLGYTLPKRASGWKGKAPGLTSAFMRQQARELMLIDKVPSTRIYTAEGKLVAIMDPLTRKRTPASARIPGESDLGPHVRSHAELDALLEAKALEKAVYYDDD